MNEIITNAELFFAYDKESGLYKPTWKMETKEESEFLVSCDGQLIKEENAIEK